MYNARPIYNTKHSRTHSVMMCNTIGDNVMNTKLYERNIPIVSYANVLSLRADHKLCSGEYKNTNIPTTKPSYFDTVKDNINADRAFTQHSFILEYDIKKKIRDSEPSDYAAQFIHNTIPTKIWDIQTKNTYRLHN